MTAPTIRMDLYERALAGEKCWVRRSDGVRQPLPTGRWFGLADASASDLQADRELLSRCDGPTIDLGCGPGRLVAELVRHGISALGVDISAMAVAVTRMRGAPAIRRDIFAELPGTGRWSYAILADGNLGIGGDPVATLARARQLISVRGTVVVEFDSCGTGLTRYPVRLETRHGVGPWHPWAQVGVENAVRLATAAGLRVVGQTDVDGRHIVWMRAT